MLQGEHFAILWIFIKLPLVIKIIVLSIFEWPFYTGFTVLSACQTVGNKIRMDILSDSVHPDLVPNCLQRLSADYTSKLRVKAI